MQSENYLLYALIVGCEIAFWVMLGAGLAVRYIFRNTRLAKYILWSVPLIDLFLLIFTALDLEAGANATFAHGLAAAYLAFTLVFGKTLITTADVWFSYKFSGGPRPRSGNDLGWSAVWYDLKMWGFCIVAASITYGLVSAMYLYVDDPERTEALKIWFNIPLGTIFFWFLFGPLWSLVFFKRVRKDHTD